MKERQDGMQDERIELRKELGNWNEERKEKRKEKTQAAKKEGMHNAGMQE